MKIGESTRRYEHWLAQQLPLIRADLHKNHQVMASDCFAFLRAMFYRWAQVWPQGCAELHTAPVLLGIGDIHIENFGTWRDAEGRLVWGTNDFDEATRLPYANDLVRLATSALLAGQLKALSIGRHAICDAILEGYRRSLTEGGQPLVLAEQHQWLHNLATRRLQHAPTFWKKLTKPPPLRSPLPAAVKRLLEQAFPDPTLPYRSIHRQAGVGSLGRQRFTLLAQWQGGWIAREAKALTISSWLWEQSHALQPQYVKILQGAVRTLDPFLSVHNGWVVRRLAPDCSRIELADLPQKRDEQRLFEMMGWEVANIHLGSRQQIEAVLRDLKRRKVNWLIQAATTMADLCVKDWCEWRVQARSA